MSMLSPRPGDDSVETPARPAALLRVHGMRRWLSLAVVVIAAYAAGAAQDRESLHSATAAAAIALLAYLHQDRRTRLDAEHDRQLYRRFLHELPADGAALRWLREPDVDAPCAAIEALERCLSGWHNVESEFANEYLGSHLRQLQREIGVLLRLLGEHPADIVTSAIRQDAQRKRLRAAASAVFLAHQNLVWQGRRLL